MYEMRLIIETKKADINSGNVTHEVCLNEKNNARHIYDNVRRFVNVKYKYKENTDTIIGSRYMCSSIKKDRGRKRTNKMSHSARACIFDDLARWNITVVMISVATIMLYRGSFSIYTNGIMSKKLIGR